MRLLHIFVIAVLVMAAAHVYEIKFESTLQAERLAKLRGEIRRERDAIATLRAEWAKLDNPARIQGLAQRHLSLRPIEPSQIDNLDHIPERPAPIVPQGMEDPIGAIIEGIDDTTLPTGGFGAGARQ